MKRNSRYLVLLAFVLAVVALPGSPVWGQNLGGTTTFGVWLEKGYRATTAQTVGADIVVTSTDSTRFRVVSRTGVLSVARDVGEIQGAFEVIMLQKFIPLGGGVDTYAQSGLGGFNQVVLDGDDEAYLFGVFEIGINLWRMISFGVGSMVKFQDEGNQYNLYAKLDFMRIPL